VVWLQGRGIPGGSVVATHGDQKIATSTDESGLYQLTLAPGEWAVEIELFSFEKQRRTITQANAVTRAKSD
jgi:hypothetical protein